MQVSLKFYIDERALQLIQSPQNSSSNMIQEIPTGPGTLIDATVQPHYSGVLRLLTHEGATLRINDAKVLLEVYTPEADVTWGAWYSRGILSNGWEPYDQPTQAAYLPFAYSDLVRIDLENAGIFLIQQSPTRETFRTTFQIKSPFRRCESVTARNPKILDDQIRVMLDFMHVPRQHIHRCASEVEDRHIFALNSFV